MIVRYLNFILKLYTFAQLPCSLTCNHFVCFLCLVLQKAFDGFAQGKGFITPEMVGQILRMIGQAFTDETLKEMIAEVDEDGKFSIQ